MSANIQLLDTVAVSRDLPECNLTAGEVGAVVEVLAPDAFEVEFCDESGQTYGLYTLHSDQLIPLHMRGHALRLRSEAA